MPAWAPGHPRTTQQSILRGPAACLRMGMQGRWRSSSPPPCSTTSPCLPAPAPLAVYVSPPQLQDERNKALDRINLLDMELTAVKSNAGALQAALAAEQQRCAELETALADKDRVRSRGGCGFEMFGVGLWMTNLKMRFGSGWPGWLLLPCNCRIIAWPCLGFGASRRQGCA